MFDFDYTDTGILIEIAVVLIATLGLICYFAGSSIVRYCTAENPEETDSSGEVPTEKVEITFKGYFCDPPDDWTCKFPNAIGSYQSPINIKSSTVIVIPPGTRKGLSFNKEYFKQPRSMTLINDGYGAVLGMCYQDEYPTIAGGPLKYKYRFNLAQFRWGPNDNEGSEHTINSKRYAMEMQLMHIKGERVYETLDVAVKQRAVVFLSFLFDVTSVDNPYLSPVVDRLENVRQPNSTFPIDPFPLCWLFQPFKSRYYYYQGSITCPPCTEGVDWLVHSEPISISHRQLNAFRRLNAFDGPMRTNCRPVQKIHNRCIQYFM